MRKISNTNELQTELRRLLSYCQTEQPSRERIASALNDLSERVASSGNLAILLDRAMMEFSEAVAAELRTQGVHAKVMSLAPIGQGPSVNIYVEQGVSRGSANINLTSAVDAKVVVRIETGGTPIMEKLEVQQRKLSARLVADMVMKAFGQI
jgi:hypothetical protein